MFDTYREIFQKRGDLYHRAMMQFPQARADEFDHIARLTDARHGHTVCDVPSGGGYIKRFLPADIMLLSAETSLHFALCCRRLSQESPIVLLSMDSLPFKARSLDRMVSLAGLHHVQEKQSLYREVYRTLKHGAAFCFADVWYHSPPARFLNEFVNEHSSMGHVGEFLNYQTESELNACGFSVTSASVQKYSWHFDALSDMAMFCGLLFGIDRARQEQILEGVDKHVGISRIGNRYGMNWELLFCKGVKR
jgi:SAM-dependent methyltransferase